MRQRAFVCLFAFVGIPVIGFAQQLSRTETTPAAPHAISGTATSARHCLSGNAANMHQLGWLQSGSTYEISFDGDVALAAAAVRFDLVAEDSITLRGTPADLARRTASISGFMVLHVGATGGAGCYRYQVKIDPPSTQVASTTGSASSSSGSALTDRPVKAVATPLVGPLAISGTPSSAQHCVAGNAVPNVHEIGRVDQARNITVSFDTDFNAMAGATMTRLDSSADARAVIQKGGNGNPGMTFSAQAGDNVVLYVAGVNGAVGCYRYRVEIR